MEPLLCLVRSCLSFDQVLFAKCVVLAIYVVPTILLEEYSYVCNSFSVVFMPHTATKLAAFLPHQGESFLSTPIYSVAAITGKCCLF